MNNCRVYRGINIDTDHHLLKATMCTPTTRRTGRRYNKNPTEPSQDVKALHIPAIRKAFVESLDQKLQESPSGICYI